MATRKKTATVEQPTPLAIEQMNRDELNALAVRVRARYSELRAQAMDEIRGTMAAFGISEKVLAEALIKRRGPRKPKEASHE